MYWSQFYGHRITLMMMPIAIEIYQRGCSNVSLLMQECHFHLEYKCLGRCEHDMWQNLKEEIHPWLPLLLHMCF